MQRSSKLRFACGTELLLSSRLPSSNHRRRDTCKIPLTPNRISAISQNLARRFCGRLHSSFQPSIDLFPPFPPSLHQASQHCRGFPCPPCKFLQALPRVIICFIFFHLAICPLHQRPIISPAIWCLSAPSILPQPQQTDRPLASIDPLPTAARPHCPVQHSGADHRPSPWLHKTHISTMRRTAGTKLPRWSHRLALGILSIPAPVELPADRTCHSPLCIEEFDLSDRNFRPCPCGYQVRDACSPAQSTGGLSR